MNRLNKVVNTAKPIRIIPMGDIHWRSENTDESGLKQKIAAIAADPDCLVVGMGDFWDSVLPADKRFDASAPYQPLDQLYAGLATLLEPIKDRFLFCLVGNHEYKLVAMGIGNPVLQFCQVNKIPYGGYATFFRLVARRPGKSNTLTIFAHHGFFAGRLRGGKVNAMESASASWDADLYLFGHSHDMVSTKRVILTPFGARQRAFVNTGTFLKTNSWGATSSYSERAGYPPTIVGSPTVEWSPWKWRNTDGGGQIAGHLEIII